MPTKKPKKPVRLTKNERRVAIARDVLFQIRAEKINPESGVWLESDDPLLLDVKVPIAAHKEPWQRTVKEEKQVKEVRAEVMPTQIRDHDLAPCNACALGAMFYSYIQKENHVKVADLLDEPGSPLLVGSYYSFREKLLKVFTEDQMALIENAFEQGQGGLMDHEGKGRQWELTRLAAEIFGQRYYKDDERLKQIMRNIIRNDGQFVPPRWAVREAMRREE
jgi:hypothetical protein